jgi:hypothetical protein
VVVTLGAGATCCNGLCPLRQIPSSSTFSSPAAGHVHWLKDGLELPVAKTASDAYPSKTDSITRYAPTLDIALSRGEAGTQPGAADNLQRWTRDTQQLLAKASGVTEREQGLHPIRETPGLKISPCMCA